MAPRGGGGHKGNKKRRRAKIRSSFRKRGAAPSRRPANTYGSSKEARLARSKWNLRQRTGLHPTKTGMMRVPTSLRNVTTHLAKQFNAGWGKNLSQSAKNRISNFAKSFPTTRVKVGIKTGVKARIGEPNYKPGKGSSPKFLPEDNEYLAAMVKYNPQGYTIKDYEKLYKKHLDKGMSLKEAMGHSKVETVPHWALFEDEKEEKTVAELLSLASQSSTTNTPNTNNSTNNNMSNTLTQKDVEKIYETHLGRKPTFGTESEFDADYWLTGHTFDEAIRGIQSGSEYKNRQAEIQRVQAGGGTITDAELDKMILPGGYKTEHHSQYDPVVGLDAFNRGNTWMGGLPNQGASWAGEQNKINQALGISAANNYRSAVDSTLGGAEDCSTQTIDPVKGEIRQTFEGKTSLLHPQKFLDAFLGDTGVRDAGEIFGKGWFNKDFSAPQGFVMPYSQNFLDQFKVN